MDTTPLTNLEAPPTMTTRSDVDRPWTNRRSRPNVNARRSTAAVVHTPEHRGRQDAAARLLDLGVAAACTDVRSVSTRLGRFMSISLVGPGYPQITSRQRGGTTPLAITARRSTGGLSVPAQAHRPLSGQPDAELPEQTPGTSPRFSDIGMIKLDTRRTPERDLLVPDCELLVLQRVEIPTSLNCKSTTRRASIEEDAR